MNKNLNQCAYKNTDKSTHYKSIEIKKSTGYDQNKKDNGDNF